MSKKRFVDVELKKNVFHKSNYSIGINDVKIGKLVMPSSVKYDKKKVLNSLLDTKIIIKLSNCVWS